MKFGTIVPFVFPRSSVGLLLLLIFASVAFSESHSTGAGTTTSTTGGRQQQRRRTAPTATATVDEEGDVYSEEKEERHHAPSHRAIPTAYTTSGGGFHTMTHSMGIIRSFYESDILVHNTTHFGGNSGGSWFQVQFSYSKDFYESATGINGDTVEEFVKEWGTRYGQKNESRHGKW